MGTASIRIRFVLIVAVLLALLFSLAIYFNFSAKRAIRNNDKIGQEDVELNRSLDAVLDGLRNLGFYVYQASFIIEQFPAKDLADERNRLRDNAEKLLDLTTRFNNPIYQQSALELHATLTVLFNQVDTLIEVQKDVERLSPAMPIMLNRMQPLNVEFMNILVGAIEDIKTDLQKPNQTNVYDTLRDLRYMWAQLVSSVRVFVANRLGAFGPARSSMQQTDSDRKIYADAIRQLLGKLKRYDEQGQLGFVQSLALKQLQTIFLNYEKEFAKVAEIYYSDKWRADHVLIREGIKPLMDKAWQQIDDFLAKIDFTTNSGQQQVASSADILSNFILMVVAIVIALLITGYFAFDYLIRRPIIQISTALEAEGAGRDYEPRANVDALEIKRLMNAFSHMRLQVRSRQSRLEAILDNAGEGILTVNRAGKIESVNKSVENLFGFKEDDMIGKPLAKLITVEQADKIEKFDIKKLIALDESQFPFEQEVFGNHRTQGVFPVSVRWGRVNIDGYWLFIALLSDISERRAMMERLTQLAERDALTGLYNRHYFMSELERIVERSHRSDKTHIALLYIDLDNFKYVNDTLGHIAGDDVLKEVTEILQQRARGSDLLARLGGDEFAILLYDVDVDQASLAAEAYRRRLTDYVFHYDGNAVDVGCSIGVAMLEPTILKKEELLARADLACNIAKRAGRNRVHLYQFNDQQKAVTMTEDMGWSRRIKRSIESNGFITVAQPIMRMRDKVITGSEILIRMTDDDELIMPAGFFPAADRFGLAVDIDRWVIANSIRLLHHHTSEKNYSFSINISAKSIVDRSVLRLIQYEIERWKVDPTRLVFEVTESGAIGNIGQAAKFLTGLHRFGCRTALDDFGVGYSSFSYLRDLPVDFVKFDGSFVRNVALDRVKQAIVTSMNDVAHVLGKQTVAEFVETQDTFEFLHGIGVDFVQGHYVGLPKALSPQETKSNVIYLTDFATPA